MGTISLTKKEDSGSTLSTWTIGASMANVVITEDTFKYGSGSMSFSYSGGSSKKTHAVFQCYIYIGSSSQKIVSTIPEGASPPFVALKAGATKNYSGQNTNVIQTSSYFNTNNPTQKVVETNATFQLLRIESGQKASDRDAFVSGTTGAISNIFSESVPFKLTLDAPPTFNATNLKSNTVSFIKDVSIATTILSNVDAKYGGHITEVKLTVGEQTVIGVDTEKISIRLKQEGTFTPVISITDSRGQITTKTLEPITVKNVRIRNYARIAI